MQIGLILNISRTLLLARLRQSVIAAVGVTFGITMFITLVSFMTGLNKLLDGLILNRTPHIRLYNEIKPSENQPVQKLGQDRFGAVQDRQRATRGHSLNGKYVSLYCQRYRVEFPVTILGSGGGIRHDAQKDAQPGDQEEGAIRNGKRNSFEKF